MKEIVLKTKRLTLRLAKHSDAEKILYMYQEKALSKFTHIPYPYTLKHAKEFIKQRRKKFGKTDYDFFMVHNKTKEIIGSLGLMNIDKADNRAKVGYIVAKKHRKQGYVTEACTALLDFGFRKLKLNRINIDHVKGNIPSQKTIKKLGAKHEGTEKLAVRTGDGKYKDHLLYAIFAKDWKKRK